MVRDRERGDPKRTSWWSETERGMTPRGPPDGQRQSEGGPQEDLLVVRDRERGDPKRTSWWSETERGRTPRGPPGGQRQREG